MVAYSKKIVAFSDKNLIIRFFIEKILHEPVFKFQLLFHQDSAHFYELCEVSSPGINQSLFIRVHTI